MLIKSVTSFTEGLKNKVTNPFFGTLISVWIIHNYKFVYTVFNFRASTGLDDRLRFISTYLESNKFLPNLGICILIAIGVLVATYILMNFSRLIVYFFDKKITPWIKKITDSKSIVSKEEYDRQKLELERVQTRFDQEHEARLKLLSDYENLDGKYKNLLDSNSVLAEKLNEEEANNKKSEKKIELPGQGFKDEKTTLLFSKFKNYLSNKELIQNFKKLSLEILKSNFIRHSVGLEDLLMKDLVAVTAKKGTETKFKHTAKGKTLLEILDHMDEDASIIVRPLDDMI